MKNLQLKHPILQNMKSELYTSQFGESSKSSILLPNASRDDSNSDSNYLLNGVMPRKYSHINKLAHGLTLLDSVSDHQTIMSSGGGDNSHSLLKHKIDKLDQISKNSALTPENVSNDQYFVTKNEGQKKLGTIKFRSNKRRLSGRGNDGNGGLENSNVKNDKISIKRNLNLDEVKKRFYSKKRSSQKPQISRQPVSILHI